MCVVSKGKAVIHNNVKGPLRASPGERLCATTRVSSDREPERERAARLY